MDAQHTLDNQQAIDALIDFLRGIDAEQRPAVVVTVHGNDKLRTLAQNRLYWQHIGQIARWQQQRTPDVPLQELKDKVHYNLKRRWLHPIYMAGTTKANLLYQQNYAALVAIKQAGIDDKMVRHLHAQLITTTDATPTQMAEYMDAYWMDMNQQGCTLTVPDQC